MKNEYFATRPFLISDFSPPVTKSVYCICSRSFQTGYKFVSTLQNDNSAFNKFHATKCDLVFHKARVQLVWKTRGYLFTFVLSRVLVVFFYHLFYFIFLHVSQSAQLNRHPSSFNSSFLKCSNNHCPKNY